MFGSEGLQTKVETQDQQTDKDVLIVRYSIVELFSCAYFMLRDINNVTGQSFKKVLEDVGGAVTLASYHTKKVLETFEGFEKLRNSLRDIFFLRMRGNGVVK